MTASPISPQHAAKPAAISSKPQPIATSENSSVDLHLGVHRLRDPLVVADP